MPPTPASLLALLRDRKYRFTILLASLFLLVGLYPLVTALPGRQYFIGLIIIDAITAAVLVASVNIAGRLRRIRMLLVLLAVPTVGLLAAGYVSQHTSPDDAAISSAIIIALHLLVITFMSIMMAIILKHVLEGGTVTLDEINGAVCVYMLLGLSGAYVYSLVFFIDPSSFNLPPVSQVLDPELQGDPVSSVFAHRQHFPSLAYYSFVTLTTLGYGDITPQTPFARMLAAMQAVFGQVYLAVLVARLIGIHLATRNRTR